MIDHLKLSIAFRKMVPRGSRTDQLSPDVSGINRASVRNYFRSRHLSYTAQGGIPALRADEFRAKAQECEDCTKQTNDPYIKKQLLDVAQRWREMAEQAERYGW
jgi:hypothetical protein